MSDLRTKLENLQNATKWAESYDPPGYWDGDTAGRRRVSDDARSGRLHFYEAWRKAGAGLDYLADGKRELASLSWEAARDCYTAALEILARPQLEKLMASAKRRGSPELAERNARLLEAFETAERQGLRGKEARNAAVKSDPGLKTAFKTDESVRKAIQRQRRGKLGQ